MLDQKQLRQNLREQRLALSDQQQLLSAAGLTRAISNSVFFQQSQHIAFHLANAGEINPQPLIEKAWEQDKQCYLPILHNGGENSLCFAPYIPDSKLINNRYGIPEPEHRLEQLLPAEQLDLVLVPLVAIDQQGNRIGMGKGYYDQTFAFLQNQSRPCKPILIGLAHSFQCVDKIEANAWDVPLDGVVDESELVLFK